MSNLLSPVELYQLKCILRKEGVTQEKLSRELGIEQGQLSRILNGHVGERSNGLRTLSKKYAHKIRKNSSLEESRDQIISAALSLWDGNQNSASQVVALLKTLKQLRTG